jgi:hypothetical protein
MLSALSSVHPHLNFYQKRLSAVECGFLGCGYSSTLIHLAVMERLDLLKEFYGEITIPLAVCRKAERRQRQSTP